MQIEQGQLIANSLPVSHASITPEIVWSAKQDKIFSTGETPTDGNTVLDVKAQSTLAGTHPAPFFSVDAYDLTDELYRMHTASSKTSRPTSGEVSRSPLPAVLGGEMWL